MADQADVYVKNVLADAINVVRKLPDGTPDLNVDIISGEQEQIYLGGSDISLVINAPGGVDVKNCLFRVISDIDLSVTCSRSLSCWGMKITPNELPPELPLTVNVTVGDDPPESS